MFMLIEKCKHHKLFIFIFDKLPNKISFIHGKRLSAPLWSLGEFKTRN